MTRESGVEQVEQRVNPANRPAPGWRRVRSAAVGLLAVLLVSGGTALAQTPDSTATPGPSASPSTVAVAISNVAELGEIEWARDIDPATNAPVRRATSFITTDPAIHAVVPVIRIVQGTVVAARWSYNDAPVPALDAEITADRSYENGWIAFTLTLPEGEIWPTGEYTVTILVNGVEALNAATIVRVPPA